MNNKNYTDEKMQSGMPYSWDYKADIIIAGAGAAGLCAAIEATECGASVIAIDQNYDVGGHALVSSGNVDLGGGTSIQKELGIEDSPDRLFADMTDFTSDPGTTRGQFRYNDRDLIRALANNCAPTFEFLKANGIRFVPHKVGGPRETGHRKDRPIRRSSSIWDEEYTDRSPRGLTESAHGKRSGAGFVRPLESSARAKGVQFVLDTKLTGLIREGSWNGREWAPSSGRVIGLRASRDGANLNFFARKGVIIATGGHTSNVEFRRIFDPRLTAEYQTDGEPYSYQSADGEIAAMAIGASLWGAGTQTMETLEIIRPATFIGCQWGHFAWRPGSRAFQMARASGFAVKDYQNLILVNQVGLRFWNEMDGSGLNEEKSVEWVHAALALNGGTSNGGGPIWAVFDSDAVKREGWDVSGPPSVDTGRFFFKADTLAELANKVVNQYQPNPMPSSALEATVAKYNSYVDGGADVEFKKPTPKYKIQKPPFYAAWATPSVHDTRAGLRVNPKAQVMDLNGHVIPGLYCAGESQGGVGHHGLGRCAVFGRLAGRYASVEPPQGL